MNKKAVSLKLSLFAIVAVSMMIIATGVIVGEWGEAYNSGINYDLSEFEDLEGVSSSAESQRERITPEDADPGTGDFEGKLFRGGYGILGRIFGSFTTIFNMIESIESRFGIPSYVSQGVITMVFFALIFAILAIIFRLSREP